MEATLLNQRCAGVLAPLFALRSQRNLGIGDIRDLYALIDWCAQQGFAFIQLLPLSPLNPEAPFPYSAYSAFGLDVSVLALDDMPDVQASASAQSILKELSTSGVLEGLRQAPRLDYGRVDAIKRQVLWEAYRHFATTHGSRRAAFDRFREDERPWLDHVALFSALKERFGWRHAWQDWPPALRDHDRSALRDFEIENHSLVEFHAYTQWVAEGQWAAMLAYAHDHGVSLMGDLPIYVGGDSADVWAHRSLFELEAQGGAPPDYYNWLGQNWSSPLYQWPRMAQDRYSWWQDRTRYHARLFDGLRFDHFRGISEYWRIPIRPAVLDEIDREIEIPRRAKEYQKVCWFWPIKFRFQFCERMSLQEWEQLSEGQRLGVLQQVGAEWVKGPGEPFMQLLLDVTQRTLGTLWVVEDLGADMDAVFELRDRLGLPGMRVVQFFGYDDRGRANPHVNPSHYPEHAMAMTDTHDLPPLRSWIQHLSADERKRIAAVYGLPLQNDEISPADFERGVLEHLLECPARWVQMSLQTVLGLGDGHRINSPGTVGPENWTWRMPMNVEDLPVQPDLLALISKTRPRPA